MRLIKLFSEHPRKIGMSYIEHLFRALGLSIALAYASIICLIHAVFPFLFEDSTSNMVSFLHDEMEGP
jgi:hypothetical protein